MRFAVLRNPDQDEVLGSFGRYMSGDLTDVGGVPLLEENNIAKGQSFAGERQEQHSSQLVEYVVDVESKLVRVKFGKKLAFGDIERYAKLLQLNPQFRPSYAEIVDLTEVEELDLDAEEFLKLADKVDPFSPEAKRAFVVRTLFQSHAAGMHKVLRPQRNIEIFDTDGDAERWIGK